MVEYLLESDPFAMTGSLYVKQHYNSLQWPEARLRVMVTYLTNHSKKHHKLPDLLLMLEPA